MTLGLLREQSEWESDGQRDRKRKSDRENPVAFNDKEYKGTCGEKIKLDLQEKENELRQTTVWMSRKLLVHAQNKE